MVHRHHAQLISAFAAWLTSIRADGGSRWSTRYSIVRTALDCWVVVPAPVRVDLAAAELGTGSPAACSRILPARQGCRIPGAACTDLGNARLCTFRAAAKQFLNGRALHLDEHPAWMQPETSRTHALLIQRPSARNPPAPTSLLGIEVEDVRLAGHQGVWSRTAVCRVLIGSPSAG